jgi:hypothetical protein
VDEYAKKLSRDERLGLIAMSTGRRADYEKLDEIGYDVVHALLFGNGNGDRNSEETLAKKYGVSRFNLKLWMRKQRTFDFIAQVGVEGILEMIAEGTSLAMLAEEHQLSNGLLEHWAKEAITPDQMTEARNAAAEHWFSHSFREIDLTNNDLELAQVKEKIRLKQWIAGNVTRRFSEDKTVRVQAGEGVTFNISYGKVLDPAEAK